MLPSLNIRYDLNEDMLARFGAGTTIGRQNDNLYRAGSGSPTCSDNGCTVTGPDPDLKPMTAKQLDASWWWFFAKRSPVTVDVSCSKTEGCAKSGAGTDSIQLVGPHDSQVKTFHYCSEYVDTGAAPAANACPMRSVRHLTVRARTLR